MTPPDPAPAPRPAGPRFPPVSVVIPARDAEATLPGALDSVLAQDYPGGVEVVVADGSEGGATAALVRARYPSVRLLPNPDRTTPAGLNLALAASSGEVVVRCDAGAALAPGYIRRAVETLRRTGAANVGARQRPVGRTPFERAVAMAMASRLGSGGARYRREGPGGPAETAWLGAFRRDAIEAEGGFHPGLERNQDYELNWRLRRRGLTVWYDPGLVADYRPRGSPAALARQYFDYGRWKRAVLRLHPASLHPRQLAAPALVLALAASAAAPLAGAPWWAALPAPLLWGAALDLAGLAALLRTRDPAALLAPVALMVMHLAWGAGFFLPPRLAGPGGGG